MKPIKKILEESGKVFDIKIAALENAERIMREAVKQHQDIIYERLISELMHKFDIKDGKVLNNENNHALIGKIDNLFAKLEKALNRDVLSGFAAGMVQAAQLSGDYYVALGFSKKYVTEILRTKIHVENIIGITATGKVKKGGYIYRLGKTDEVRNKLKDYIMRSLTSDVSFLDLQLGFRNLVKGNKRIKGVATNGILERYFDQYAYDSFTAIDAGTNKIYAKELGLNHFQYVGGLIRTSRAFCIKRDGKVFKVKDTKKWKHDPDLIDKKTADTYRPLIERGRYRCRHILKYITKALYEYLNQAA